MNITGIISFNASDIKKIKQGTKTMFRQMIEPRPLNSESEVYRYVCSDTKDKSFVFIDRPNDIMRGKALKLKPIFTPGGIIVVKEPYMTISYSNKIVFEADTSTCMSSWKDASSMPIEKARTFLRVLSIKPERLLDISKNDVIKEGYGIEDADFERKSDEKYSVIDFLESIPSYVIKDNPWQWVVEFEEVQNEEEIQEIKGQYSKV